MMRAGTRFAASAARSIFFGLLAACVAPQAAATDFGRERASHDTRQVAAWIIEEGDNQVGDGKRLPFAILDKKDARVYVFHPDGQLVGAAPALLGRGRGDTAPPGIGARELSDIPPKDRITQAGRFVTDIGFDAHGEDVLWLDYDGGLAMHRVITTNPKERRLHRLATPTPDDNRISWGCINLPVKFYESVVQPSFTGTKGIVYVLPEHRQALAFFAALNPAQRSSDQRANRTDSNRAADGH